jgi:hypothetical protein
MKSTTLLLLLILANSGFSQETLFKITKDGITDYIVTPCEGKTQNEIYKKTVEWISLTFKNSKEVIQSQIENDMIRIEGFAELFNGTSNATYLVEISFKEGKYKFDPVQFTIINGINKFDFFPNFTSYFKSDGSIKERLKDTVTGIENLINGLNIKLKEYVLAIKSDTKKSDW